MVRSKTKDSDHFVLYAGLSEFSMFAYVQCNACF